ncbi:hypothetical protein LSH36_498g02012 [Paralvinella palmiformis]|uniref:G-protein coupled receptors family 1 profile domain-containing protein n=1 Tax=Paralvinella palmiformis TaxID=53620 RepID=A0AAD9MWL0_9ANNE|nr:hypothetical protein LSH36_498g02012 [Paralvinella palmiformis]
MSNQKETSYNASDVLAWAGSQPAPVSWSDPEYLFSGLLIPAFGAFGVVGNILNLTILSWRYNKREINVLERGALLGLIALAVSDLCFCLGILPGAVFYDSKAKFSAKTFHYYYQLYGVYLHDVFIKISTWLTVVIATARYVAICHPLKARIFAGLFATKVAIVVTYAAWFLLLSPILWSYHVYHYEAASQNVSFFLLDIGQFAANAPFRLSFTYLWALLGYFFPVVVLAFCNIKLIRALRESVKWRECSARNAPSGREGNTRITSTLVCLIAMFIVLVSPSELLHFYLDVAQPETYASTKLAILSVNLLQTVNFSFHFVLYCAVNVTFRRTIVNAYYCLLAKVRRSPKQRGLQYSRSISLTRGPTNTFKSVETQV